ncbi:alpha/beta hydrolase family esterase [Kribbella sp. NPDC059898]|uniref:alpha/beta hydrolase family esterase n=1 Tax=Kribbella sp. NPDC059898 TaxID=3346995 RepID=UPI00365CE501
MGGRDRTFTIREPAPGRQRPLVLMLHGNNPGGDGARTMRELTTFDEQAAARGFAIASPDGVGGSWADGRGVTSADEAGVNDVAFLAALIEWSADRYGTSADRNIVAGISNGAFMAHRFALEASERVAVLAAVAGGMPADLSAVQPQHAVSALLIHGTADRISPIDGGYSRRRGPQGELRGRTLSLAETADRWRTIDRCPAGPGTTYRTDLSSRTDSATGAGGTRVTAWTVLGGGHSWPGAPTGDWEPTSQEFDAAEEICRFAEPLLAGAEARQL